jgi:hypothetical protein
MPYPAVMLIKFVSEIDALSEVEARRKPLRPSHFMTDKKNVNRRFSLDERAASTSFDQILQSVKFRFTSEPL